MDEQQQPQQAAADAAAAAFVRQLRDELALRLCDVAARTLRWHSIAGRRGGNRLFDLIDAVGGLDTGFQFSGGDQGGDFAEYRDALCRRSADKPLRQPETAQRDVAEHERGRRDLAGFAAHRAVIHQHPALGQGHRQMIGAGTADGIDTEPAGGTAGGPLRRCHPLT